MRVRAVLMLVASVAIVGAGAAWFATVPQPGRSDAAVAIAPPPPVVTETADPVPAVPAAVQKIVPDATWVAKTAAATGIPARSLLSYASAAIITSAANPGCHLGWNSVAALGWAESADGTIDGSVLDANGTVQPGIFGPALDGTRFDAVRDTDSGSVDGDTQWDRAVGPLQFLPATWLAFGADANGDGIADPQNIDDAALGAAGYLCAGGRDLAVASAWTAAVQAYNPNDEYVGRVRDRAIAYAHLVG